MLKFQNSFKKTGFIQHLFVQKDKPVSFISKKGAGFTLIESAVAISVLLVGLLAVVQFFPFGIKIIGDAQNLTVASNLAVAQLEETIALDYDLITVGTLEAKGPVSNDPSNYLNHYQRQTLVEYIDSNFQTSNTDVGLKRITVTTYWLSPASHNEKSTEVYTVIVNQ